MYDLLCRADCFFLSNYLKASMLLDVKTDGTADGSNEWDFLKDGGGKDGVFSSLIDKTQDIGASGYELLMTVGVIGLIFSIIFTAVSLLLTNNAQKKEEKKSHAMVICIAGIVIFSVFSIVGFFKSIGSGL